MKKPLFAMLLVLAGCSPANVNDGEYWTPSTASDEVVGDDGGTPPPPPSDSGTKPPSTDSGTKPPTSGNCLHVAFTTVSTGGRYAPNHVAAVWITDASGKFVKTLREWGVRRSGYLVTWRRDSGGSTVDAVTGATLSAHGPLSLDWNCTDTAKNRVPNGKYTVHAEFTEMNGQGPVFDATFEIGPSSNTSNPADSSGFKAKTITFTP